VAFGCVSGNSASIVRTGTDLSRHGDVLDVQEHGTAETSLGFTSFTTLCSSGAFTAHGLELEIFVSGDRRVRKLRVCPTGATPAAHTRSCLGSAQ
jgi:hypothetical protein